MTKTTDDAVKMLVRQKVAVTTYQIAPWRDIAMKKDEKIVKSSLVCSSGITTAPRVFALNN